LRTIKYDENHSRRAGAEALIVSRGVDAGESYELQPVDCHDLDDFFDEIETNSRRGRSKPRDEAII